MAASTIYLHGPCMPHSVVERGSVRRTSKTRALVRERMNETNEQTSKRLRSRAAVAAEAPVGPEPKKFVVPIFPKKQAANPEVKKFVWDHSKCLVLSNPKCSRCRGAGMTPGRGFDMVPCGCVLRKAFNSCLGKYRYIQALQDRVTSCVPVLMKQGSDTRFCWSRKNEEFAADFILIARRTLKDDLDWRLFELYMLEECDWRFCARALGIDRGSFFCNVYRIQQACGRAFMETQPYALYPLDQYFSAVRINNSNIREAV